MAQATLLVVNRLPMVECPSQSPACWQSSLFDLIGDVQTDQQLSGLAICLCYPFNSTDILYTASDCQAARTCHLHPAAHHFNSRG